jgi:hypothetical protein
MQDVSYIPSLILGYVRYVHSPVGSDLTDGSVLAVCNRPATCLFVLAVAKTNRQHLKWEVPAQTFHVL